MTPEVILSQYKRPLSIYFSNFGVVYDNLIFSSPYIQLREVFFYSFIDFIYLLKRIASVKRRYNIYIYILCKVGIPLNFRRGMPMFMLFSTTEGDYLHFINNCVILPVCTSVHPLLILCKCACVDYKAHYF